MAFLLIILNKFQHTQGLFLCFFLNFYFDIADFIYLFSLTKLIYLITALVKNIMYALWSAEN